MSSNASKSEGQRRPSSAASHRFAHATTVQAFTKRIEAVRRGSVLTPHETQQYKHPSLCDFERLAKPKERILTRSEQCELKALRRFREAAQHVPTPEGRRSSSSFSDEPIASDELRGGSPPRAHSSSGHLFQDGDLSRPALGGAHKEQLGRRPGTPTPAQITEWKQAAERLQRVAEVWPTPHAVQATKQKQERLNPHILSSALRRAVYGQSLDRVLQKSRDASSLVGGVDNATLADQDTHHDELHVTMEGVDIGPSTSKRNKNNNIFLMAAQEAAAGSQADDALDSIASAGANENENEVAELEKLADPAYRKSLHSIGHREYTLIRKLFQELDDKREGVVELAQVLSFHNRYPKRLARDILDNLKVELDGRIFLDELVRVHFPSVPQASIEQLMELYEPKVQSMDSIRTETMKHLERLYLHIVATYASSTFPAWVATLQQQQQGAAVSCKSPPVGPTSQLSIGSAGTSALCPPHSSRRHSLEDSGATMPMDDDRVSQRSGRASSISRSDAGTQPPSSRIGRRASASPSIASGSHHASFPLMNALQLLLHLQHTSSSFSVKELLQLFRLKHVALRPSYSVQLTRAIRRTAAGARFAKRSSVACGGLSSVSSATVADPVTGVAVPYHLFQGPTDTTGAGGATMTTTGALGDCPSVPYLTHCHIRFQDFVILMMDYYVMKQDDVMLEPYDPYLKAYLDRLSWEKLFPYTGPVQGYFKTFS